MKRPYGVGVLLAALTFAGGLGLRAQTTVSSNWPDFLIVDGKTAYDDVNGVTWLRDANLAATTDVNAPNPDDQPPRFGLPLCDADSTEMCIWPDGAMSYTSAQEWVKRMNAAGYLGQSHWRLPSTPQSDPSCGAVGPSDNSFAFGCTQGALGFLFYRALGLGAPNTAVPIPANTVGPFQNFQPGVYWSHSAGGGLPGGKANFSFLNGSRGGTTTFNYGYVLPMIKGRIPGVPPPTGNGLELSPNGLTVYDPLQDVTWPANANLAAQEPFSLQPCEGPNKPSPCVAADGAMKYDAAEQFVADMNAANYGAETDKQLTWEIPEVDPKCPQYGCDTRNPMGELYYDQLGLAAGTSVVPIPDTAVGPFHHVQPSYYWTCESDVIDHPCTDASPVPNTGAQFDFSFGSGFLSTAREKGAHFVMVYFAGCDLPDAEECVRVKDPGPRKF